jgi:hypothetical protein
VRLSSSAKWFPAKLLGGGAADSRGNGRLANAAGLGELDLDRGERRSLSRASASRAQAGSRGWLEIPDVDEKRGSMARRAARPAPFVGSLFPIES